MKDIYKFDENGFYVCMDQIEVEEIPEGYTDVKPEIPSENGLPTGFIKPKWDAEKWIEGATLQEIEARKTIQLSGDELLQKQQTDLVFELMMKGVL